MLHIVRIGMIDSEWSQSIHDSRRGGTRFFFSADEPTVSDNAGEHLLRGLSKRSYLDH
jgi:hypothetical protein